MDNTKQTCQICPNHCPENALSCEKGKAFFEGSSGQGHGSIHGKKPEWHGNHHHDNGGHTHFDSHTPTDSLAGLFMQSGHCLFHYSHEHHGNADALFDFLTDEEKAELKRLLTKLLKQWNQSS